MAFEITAYSTQRMRAEAHHAETAHWVEVKIVEPRRRREPEESSVTIFFDGPDAARKADAYANAINVVDAEFHPLTSRVDAILEGA